MTIGSLYVICLCSLTDRSFKVLSITIKWLSFFGWVGGWGVRVVLKDLKAQFIRLEWQQTLLRIKKKQTIKNVKLHLKPHSGPNSENHPQNSFTTDGGGMLQLEPHNLIAAEYLWHTSWHSGRINPHWFRELIREGLRDKERQKRLIDRMACSCYCEQGGHTLVLWPVSPIHG